MKNYLPIGCKVKVSEGSGIDSNKIGRIIPNNELPIDNRNIPKLIGHYKPVNWNEESAIRLESGELTTMYDNRLSRVY